MGIARGGVPVAAEVARSLGAPLDVVVVRKVGAPENPEYGIGALAEGGVSLISDEAVRALGITEARSSTHCSSAARRAPRRPACPLPRRPRAAARRGANGPAGR